MGQSTHIRYYTSDKEKDFAITLSNSTEHRENAFAVNIENSYLIQEKAMRDFKQIAHGFFVRIF